MKKHTGSVYRPAYLLRNAVNQQALDEVKRGIEARLAKHNEQQAAARAAHDEAQLLLPTEERAEFVGKPFFVPDLDYGPRPGDVEVSRDFRAVYLRDTTGARRRVEGDAAKAAVEKVKELIAREAAASAPSDAADVAAEKVLFDTKVPVA